MKPLSDLLEEAVAAAPPARYDIDDVVAAGRRRLHCRRAAWATGSAFVMAAAVTVPLAVLPGAAPAPPRPVQPAASATAPSATAPAFTFAGYRAGDLRVKDPTVWSPVSETAEIQRGGATTGSLMVYRAGADPTLWYKRPPTLTGIPPVGGRAAFLVDIGTGARDLGLVWEYAAGARAVVTGQDGAMTVADLRRVAEAFTTSVPRPIRIAFRTRSVPAGYRLVSVLSDPDSGVRSSVTLVPAAEVAGRPERGRPADDSVSRTAITVRLSSGSPHILTVPRQLTCEDTTKGALCSAPALPGNTELVGIGVAVDEREVRKFVARVQAADPDKPATWWPVSEAVPASALLPAN